MSHNPYCPCGKPPSEYTSCDTEHCYSRISKERVTSTKSAKYLWVSAVSGTSKVITDLQDLLLNPNFNIRTDTVHELGPQVELQLVAKPKE